MHVLSPDSESIPGKLHKYKEVESDASPTVQDLVKSNGGRYFTNQLLMDVSKVVEPVKEDRMKDGTSRTEAIRAVNKDIVDQGNIWGTVMEGVIAILRVAVPIAKATVASLASRCSVM